MSAKKLDRKDIIFMLVLAGFVVGVVLFYERLNFTEDVFPDVEGHRGSHLITDTSKSKRVFQKNVEVVLNDMLGGVYAEVQAYRTRKKIVSDLIRPKNLRNVQYIDESYELSQSAIPDLLQRSVLIVQIFNEKETDIKRLVKDRPQAAQDRILSAWKKVKREQVDLYVQYFSLEQEKLLKYQELLNLFYENKSKVLYHEDLDQVYFEDESLNNKIVKIRSDIRDFDQLQASLFQ